MTQLFPNYKRKNIEFVAGDKNYLIDSDGKKYLDFTSGIGVVNLGYNHPVLNQVLKEQSEKIWHTPNLYENSLQEDLAKQLAGASDYLAYFCNSGAEANEAAIKLARKATGRSKIITFEQSFHGRTFGAMSATGQAAIHQGFYPLLPEFAYVPYNALDKLEQELDGNTAAVMLELIQGEGGVIPAEKQWIKQVVALCEKNGSLVIVDECRQVLGEQALSMCLKPMILRLMLSLWRKVLAMGFQSARCSAKRNMQTHFKRGAMVQPLVEIN